MMRHYRPGLAASLCVLLWFSGTAHAADVPSVFAEDVARFTRLASSDVDALRIEAAQGFRYLQHAKGEKSLLPLVHAKSPLVRLEATKALGLCGGRKSVPVFIDLLTDRDWEVRSAAHAALVRMTGQRFPADAVEKWRDWLDGSDWLVKQRALLDQLRKGDRGKRLAALKALRFIGDTGAETDVLAVLAKPGDLKRDGMIAAIRALERIGTKRSLPLLVKYAVHFPAATWPLAEIGGPEAETALIQAFRKFRTHTPDAVVNLDRIESKRGDEVMPLLLSSFGLVIYRVRPDELHRAPDVYQRAAARLILRTGKSQRIVELILAQVEGTRKDADTPKPLRKLLAGMKHELKKGFVRSDGMTVAQPLAALPHIATDKRFVPRLIALLKHQAYIVRIYAAETLASLRAEQAVPKILEVIREGYPFSDATRLASGKHFGHSRTIRWRGYLCIALGKLGGDAARTELEKMACDVDAFRDIRYGSVVGLRFLGSPASIPALERVAKNDIVWAIRQVAENAIEEIKLKQRQVGLAAGDGG